jgi:hypothetical protein
MFRTLANLFLGNRRSGLARLFHRRRQGGVVNAVNNHRGASALGTLATIAAPYVIRKLMQRREQRAAAV